MKHSSNNVIFDYFREKITDLNFANETPIRKILFKLFEEVDSWCHHGRSGELILNGELILLFL